MAHYGPNFLFVSPFVPEAQLKVDGLRVVQKNAATCVRCLAAQVQRVAGPTCRFSGVWQETLDATKLHTHTHTEDFFLGRHEYIQYEFIFMSYYFMVQNKFIFWLIISIGFIFHPWGHDPSDAGIVVTGLKPTSMWVSLMFWAPQICKFKMVRWQF